MPPIFGEQVGRWFIWYYTGDGPCEVVEWHMTHGLFKFQIGVHVNEKLRQNARNGYMSG